MRRSASTTNAILFADVGMESATGTAGKNRASPAIFGGSKKKMAKVKGRSLAFFFNGDIVVDGADRAGSLAAGTFFGDGGEEDGAGAGGAGGARGARARGAGAGVGASSVEAGAGVYI